MLNEDNVRNFQWYANELEAYQAEKDNGINKSDYYEGLIDFMLWKYEQLENVSKEMK